MTGYTPGGYYEEGCHHCGHGPEVHLADDTCTGIVGIPGHVGKTTTCACPRWRQAYPQPSRTTADGLKLVYTPTVLSVGDYVQMGDNHFIVALEGAAWRLIPMPAPEPPVPPYVETLALVWVDTGLGAGRILGDASAAAAIDAISKRLDDVDGLANEIRRVDGNHDMGAGALAEHLVSWMRERLV